MQNPPGTFIVIEGSDGSGKQTQMRLLAERLRAVGYEVAEFDFPQYEQESSYFVKQYLEGRYGPAAKVNPYAASLFFALDRFEAAPKIRQALEDGKIVLSNRYTGANMAHQGLKLTDPIEQRSYFVWADSLEFQLLGIPRPSLNLFLKVPANVSRKLIEERAKRSGSHLDEHERDLSHLKKAVETFELMCQIFPQDFQAINCVKDDELLGIPDISNLIWDVVTPLLPAKPTGPAHSVVLNLNETASAATKQGVAKASAPGSKLTYNPGKLSLELLMKIERTVPGSTRYKLSWEKSGYDYVVPAGLPKNTRKKYEEGMEALGDTHKQMRDHLKKNPEKDHILAPAIPMGALVESQLRLSPQDIQKLVHNLGAEQDEARRLFAGLLREGLGKQAAKSMSGAMSKRPGEISSVEEIITKLVKEHLSPGIERRSDTVTLLEAMPRNEFKILADVLYPFSNLPREDLEAEVDKLTYAQKCEALESALKAPEGTVADRVVYKFDIVADRLLLDKIGKARLASHIHLQAPTPRYGYDVPKRVDELGIDEQYLECFDKSLELFSTLQAAGREEDASYATLVGHKTRFQLECSLTALKNAAASVTDQELSELIKQMAEKVVNFHPIIGEGLIGLFEKPAAKPQKTPSKRNSRSRRRPNHKKSK